MKHPPTQDYNDHQKGSETRAKKRKCWLTRLNKLNQVHDVTEETQL